jgi:SAM-dependent methyltransferase
MSDPRTRIVGEGYDAMADHFADWRDRIVGDPRDWWTEQLTKRLSDGARILELGCGAGVPDTRRLAERFRVTGVDISQEQIARARANVPEADFIQADFTSLELEPSSFDAVAAFYVLNHVPRDLLAPLLTHIHAWLVPDGYLLAAFGTGNTEGWVGEWLGTTMFFSSFPPETNRRLLDEAGFDRLLDEVVTFTEPEPDGEARFQWVLARR